MALEKIQHIIRYIELNYNQDLSIRQLEKLSHYSYRNIQRVFKNLFHESIGAFHKRLKLENAYKKIIYTQESITNISYEVGFVSVQSFSKSFKKQFNISPSLARLQRKVVFESFLTAHTTNSLPREIVFLNKAKVYFKSIQTENYRTNEINKLWKTIDNISGGDSVTKFYELIVDQPLITTRTKCRYEACIDIDLRGSDFITKEIFGGRYAKYTHHGGYDTIEETYRHIYDDLIFNSTLEFDNSPIVEHYVNNKFNSSCEKEYTTEIFIPLKS